MVQCKDCAYLSLKNVDQTEYLEVDVEYRQNGLGYGNLRNASADGPLCFVRACDLRYETLDLARDNVGEPKRTLTVIENLRECASFAPWVLGYSPKEHAEKMHNAQLIQIAEDRKQADEERAAKRRREDKEWQAQESHRNRTYARWTAVLSAIFGALSAFVLGAFKESKTQPPNIQIVIPTTAKD